MKHGYIKVNTPFRDLLSVIKINYTVYHNVILHIFNIYSFILIFTQLDYGDGISTLKSLNVATIGIVVLQGFLSLLQYIEILGSLLPVCCTV